MGSEPKPLKVSTGFNGAIQTRVIAHPSRAFAFEVRMTPENWPKSLLGKLPPLHFHPYQEEYISVTSGHLCVEIEGKIHTLSSSDGEMVVRPGFNHRLYPPKEFFSEGEEIVFLLGGQATEELFRLDAIFFENWYGYQDEFVMGGFAPDVIQVMSMFDAGGSYLSLPWFVPFRNMLAQGLGIVLGRWVGGLLGYQPFYHKWTGDWDLACQKMGSSQFQKRFADCNKTD